jgi:hypothetical protein
MMILRGVRWGLTARWGARGAIHGRSRGTRCDIGGICAGGEREDDGLKQNCPGENKTYKVLVLAQPPHDELLPVGLDSVKACAGQIRLGQKQTSCASPLGPWSGAAQGPVEIKADCSL